MATKIITIILLICLQTTLFAQNKVIDSLDNLLKKHPQSDTIKAKILNELSAKYRKSNLEKMLERGFETKKYSDFICRKY